MYSACALRPMGWFCWRARVVGVAPPPPLFSGPTKHSVVGMLQAAVMDKHVLFVNPLEDKRSRPTTSNGQPGSVP